MPKLSVIVPAYGVRDFLEKCLNSILAQTYRDMEIVVVDDGSRDGSGALADEMARQHPQLRVIHKQNEGLPQARRTGVENAAGEYIGFVDGDDYIEPDMYAVLMDLIQRHDADIACANFYWEEPDGRRRKNRFKDEGETAFTVEEAFIDLHRSEGVRPNMWNKVYKKTLFEGIDYPTGNPIGEDYCIQVQLIPKSARIVQVDTPVYHYIQWKKSMSHMAYSPDREKSLLFYEHWRGELVRRYPALEPAIIPYHLREELGAVIAMAGGNIDPVMAKKVQLDTRQHFVMLLRSNEELRVKVGAFFALFNWRVLIAYGTLNKILVGS